MKRNSLPKATLAQVKKDIAPFVKKRSLGGSYIEGANVQTISNILRHRYSNVKTEPKPVNGRAMYTIHIGGFLNGGTLTYEIRNNGMRPKVTGKPDKLGWIDRLEELDAALDD